MACDSPLQAYRSVSGGISFDAKGGGSPLRLACGRCRGCRLERSRQWAVRCDHERRMHEFNSFITLTYSSENLPVNGWLQYRDFQLFMKRLRKRFTGISINFFMCGEYGATGRAHYHAIIFGIDFADRVPYRMGASGCMSYTSVSLSKLWGLGECFCGDVTFESAAYCARYIMKKLIGREVVEKIDSRHSINLATGEIFVPEFTHMSLKRPIGRSFFDKYRSDIFPHDRIVSRGTISLPPRYYSRIYKRVDPDSWDDVMRKRGRFTVAGEGTPERLAVKAQVREARIRSLVRNSF